MKKISTISVSVALGVNLVAACHWTFQLHNGWAWAPLICVGLLFGTLLAEVD